MSATDVLGSFDPTDPIALEVLRGRLEAIAEDAALAIERTGVSPTATETHDLSATLLDAEGGLVAGGGWVSYHWVAATRAVRYTLAAYGDSIAPGDVFLANDPYHGGGLHPNDVFVERPIFVGDRLVAWVALSAHLVDMGGMSVGTFSPAATECYQEAFRIPPVRLFRRGHELRDVWDLLRVNVRLPMVVEMDLRALVAGAHVAQEKLVELVDALGLDFVVDGMRVLQELSERELRTRIAALPDGTYRTVGWVEWDDELYEIPCTLDIDGDSLVFDFAGAAPQAPHFFNSQPYIIKSAMVMQFARVLAADLPYTEGLLAPIEMRCPEGTIVNARPPAPMNAGHMHVGGTAAELMLQCVRLALWAADPALDASRFVHGWSGSAAIAVAIWSGIDADGDQSIWGMVESSWAGCTAGPDRDGIDMATVPVGMAGSPSSPDVEVVELWHPILVRERSVRGGLNGAGRFRSGGGTLLRFEPYGTDALEGQMLGIREWLPLEGAGGGFPGSTAEFTIERPDGAVERVSTKASGVTLRAGEVFQARTGSGGGVGDPVERDPARVAADVAVGRLAREDAAAVYGVVLDDAGAADVAATQEARAAILADRLARASAPARPVADDDASRLATGETAPPNPRHGQHRTVGFAAASGTPLAIAPDHWTEGCAVIVEPCRDEGPALDVRTYLDPRTGTCLYVEVVPAGYGRAFAVSPRRWTDAAPA